MTTAKTDYTSIKPTALVGDLSTDAKQAVAWLFSDHAKNLSVIESRACILEGWGKRVDDELRAYFSPNVIGSARVDNATPNQNQTL